MYLQILLGERAHLIEFPSILLPPGATTGSIVNIAVHQNHAEEKKRDSEFWNLQEDILSEFGSHSPEAPELKVCHVYWQFRMLRGCYRSATSHKPQ